MVASVEELAARILREDARFVFFVGSFLSTRYPAYLPTAAEVLGATVKMMAPPDADPGYVELLSERCLPESYYATAFDLFGKDVLQLWSVLDYQLGEARKVDVPFGPTAAHLAIVFLAKLFDTPIITPNYDLLFELAAERLGLEMQVYLPGNFRSAQADPGFSLWKVHGSCHDDVYALLPQIARSNEPLLQQLHSVLRNRELIFIGYSGRDIDLFPFLTSWNNAPQKIWWVDPAVCGDEHMAQLSAGLRQAKVNEVPARDDQFLAGIMSGLPKLVDEAFSEQLGRPSGERNIELDRHLDVISSLVPIEPSLDDPRRRLLYVQGLMAIGENALAQRYLAKIKPKELAGYVAFRFWMCRAKVEHELAQFDDSEESAKRAETVAKTTNLRECRFEARSAIVEARRMQVTANYVCGRYSSSGTDLFSVGLQFFWHALRSRTLLAKAKKGDATYRELLSAFAAIEHRIRMYSLLQGLLKKWFKDSATGLLMRVAWYSVKVHSLRIGYAAGIANQAKFRERLIRGNETLLSPNLLYNLLWDQTGKVIRLRDEAEAEYKRQNFTEAVRLFDLAAEAARAIGDPSLELKAYVGIVASGGKPDISMASVSRLAERIQGKVHLKIRPTLLTFIASAYDH